MANHEVTANRLHRVQTIQFNGPLDDRYSGPACCEYGCTEYRAAAQDIGCWKVAPVPRREPESLAGPVRLAERKRVNFQTGRDTFEYPAPPLPTRN